MIRLACESDIVDYQVRYVGRRACSKISASIVVGGNHSVVNLRGLELIRLTCWANRFIVRMSSARLLLAEEKVIYMS